MLFHWVIFFTSVISINSISQTADNVDSQPVVYSDDSISSQDALLLDTNSDAQPSSQNSPFSEIDSSQNSVAAETGLSQDAVTAGTDLSQAEFAAETDSSRILITDCTSAAPTVDVDDENNQILARNDNAQFCRAEPDVPPLTKPIPPSPREADPNLVPVPPRILPKLKRPPGSEPATPPEKPTIRTKPSDGGNPCPVRDGKHQGRKVHVTCGGPEAVISGMFSSESRFVVNCLLGKSFKLAFNCSNSSPFLIGIRPNVKS